MSEPDLARRAHLNMVEAFASLAPHQTGGFVRRHGGVVVAATGSPIALFNEILPVDDGVTAEALLQAVETVRAAGLPSLTQLREGVDDALLPVVGQLGLVERPDVSWPAMVLSDLPSAPVATAGLQISHTADGSGSEEHFRASVSVASRWPREPEPPGGTSPRRQRPTPISSSTTNKPNSRPARVEALGFGRAATRAKASATPPRSSTTSYALACQQARPASEVTPNSSMAVVVDDLDPVVFFAHRQRHRLRVGQPRSARSRSSVPSVVSE